MNATDAALEVAGYGLWVFPCGLDKRPKTKNGFKDAVTDKKEVRALFDWAGDDTLVGVKTGQDSDLIVIDFDLYKGDTPKSYMEELTSKGLLPETRVHATKSGGIHVLYRGNGAGYPTVNPVDGVEVKGEGGYIIWWPVSGCDVLHEGLTAAPPSLIAALIAARSSAASDSIDDLKQKILSGDNFHDSLTRLAARLSAKGMDRAAVMEELMRLLQGSVAASEEHERHDRWKQLMADNGQELSRIVGTGHTKYNSKAASESLGEEDYAAYEQLRQASAQFGFSPNRGEPRIKKVEEFQGFPFEDEGYFAHYDHDLLSQRFIMHPLLCEEESVLIAAEPKTGKTAVALTVGLHIACGLDLGSSLRVAEPRGVLYFGLEGRRAIRLRIAAWRRYMGERGEVLPDNIPLFVVERSKNLLHENERQSLANAIKATDLWMEKEYGYSLGAIFIDTYTKAMPGGNQNTVEDTSAVFDVVGRIRAHDIKAAIAFIHHKARAGNVRGSTNIEADPDVLTSIDKQGDTIVWRLDRARSVEEGGSYYFKVHNYTLGTSSQGFAINAPVIEATLAILDSNYDIRSAEEDARMLSTIIRFGIGVHELVLIKTALDDAGFSPAPPSRRGRRKVSDTWDSETYQAFISKLIPDTGYSFGGYTIDKVYDVNHSTITHLSIR